MYLENQNILLRAIEPNDIDFIGSIENDSRSWSLSNTHNPFSRFDIEQYVMSVDKDIYSSKQLRLIIDLKNTSASCGIIDVFDFDAHNRRAGVGIIINDEYRKKGIASQALDLLIDYAFNYLNLHQLFCNISADNKASLELFKTKNFMRSGTKKDWIRRNNSYVDEYVFQLINNSN